MWGVIPRAEPLQPAPSARLSLLLYPPLPLVGASIAMERERQQNDSLVNGYSSPLAAPPPPAGAAAAGPLPAPSGGK